MNDLKLLVKMVESLRVLVVDDEDLIRNSMVSFMKRFFKDVQSADDGNDALEKFNQNGPFDIVLTDIRMPKMTGNELVKILNGASHNIFLAVMSGSPEDIQNDLEYCDIFMEKPIALNEMIGMIELIVEKNKLH